MRRPIIGLIGAMLLGLHPSGCSNEQGFTGGPLRWTGAITIQQRIKDQRSEMCFGPVLLSDPPTATDCPGIVIGNYRWLAPPTAAEVGLGSRLTSVWLEGELSADHSSFQITKLIEPTKLSADELALVQDPRPLRPPPGFSCLLPSQTLGQVLGVIRAKRLDLMPLAMGTGVEELPPGEAFKYRLSVAFASDDIFRRLCDSGVSVSEVQIVDPMKPVEG
jgi:hypothetical protein